MGVSVQPEPSASYALATHGLCVGLVFMGQLDLARSFLERAEATGDGVSDPDPAFVMRLMIARGFVELFGGRFTRRPWRDFGDGGGAYPSGRRSAVPSTLPTGPTSRKGSAARGSVRAMGTVRVGEFVSRRAVRLRVERLWTRNRAGCGLQPSPVSPFPNRWPTDQGPLRARRAKRRVPRASHR